MGGGGGWGVNRQILMGEKCLLSLADVCGVRDEKTPFSGDYVN